MIQFMFVEDVDGYQTGDAFLLLGVVSSGLALLWIPGTVLKAFLSQVTAVSTVTAPVHTCPPGSAWPVA
jgi:hypothetical protein